MSTLYAIVTELDVSLDDVFRVHDDELSIATAVGAESDSAVVARPVVHPTERHVVELDSGVVWERLTSHEHEDVDFLHVIYDVGGSSASDERLMRHPGREYGYVLGAARRPARVRAARAGTRRLDRVRLDHAHRLWNLGDEAVHGIWFVVGRDG